MNLLSQLKLKLQRSGVRGSIASAFRQTASIIDQKKLNNTAESNQNKEFLEWVRFAVPGMLTNGNVDAMEYAIANMPESNPILEIGSFCGLSTTVLSYLLEKHSKTNAIYTCDKWEFEGQKPGKPLGDSPSVTHDIYRDYVKSSFINNMQTFAANRLPYTIECFSDDFFQLWFENQETVDVFDRAVTLGGKISFCYIDGNHTYEYAKRDFENTDPALVSGGFILFDDSYDGSHWGVNQLVREIAAGHQYELVSKNPNYFFRKK